MPCYYSGFNLKTFNTTGSDLKFLGPAVPLQWQQESASYREIELVETVEPDVLCKKDAIE